MFSRSIEHLVPVLESDWSHNFPRELMCGTTTLRLFTFCITQLVCIAVFQTDGWSHGFMVTPVGGV